MYVLVLIFLYGHLAIDIETYSTQVACEQAKDYIMSEMDKVYAPNDRDYRLECHFRPKHT